MTRAVLGERIWSVRADPRAGRQDRRLRLLAAAAVPGVPLLAWGLWAFDLAATVLGIAIVVAGKLAFVARTAHLYDEVAAARPDLRYRPPR